MTPSELIDLLTLRMSEMDNGISEAQRLLSAYNAEVEKITRQLLEFRAARAAYAELIERIREERHE